MSIELKLSPTSNASLVSLRQLLTQLVSPSDSEISYISQLFREKSLQAGEHFLKAGEYATELGFVNSGLLRFYYATSDGKEVNKSFILENQFASGYNAFLSQTPMRFSIQALEDTQLVVCDLQAVVDLFDEYRCVERLCRLLVEQLYIKKEQREAEFLLDDAETRYKNFLARFPDLENRITQYHVASYLGITPVMLSRIRRR